jgi:hypothetical protein
MAQYVYSNPQVPQTQADSTLSKIGIITEGAGGLISAIDQALHPGRYPNTAPYPQQTYPVNTGQPAQSGMGVGKWLLIAAMGGGALWAGKELMDKKSNGKKTT